MKKNSSKLISLKNIIIELFKENKAFKNIKQSKKKLKNNFTTVNFFLFIAHVSIVIIRK